MVNCCISKCPSRKGGKYPTTVDPDITFHKFPRDAIKRAEWATAAGRSPDWDPKTATVCSRHFRPCDLNRTYASGIVKVREDAVPSLHLPYRMVKEGLVMQPGFLLFTGKKANSMEFSEDGQTEYLNSSSHQNIIEVPPNVSGPENNSDFPEASETSFLGLEGSLSEVDDVESAGDVSSKENLSEVSSESDDEVNFIKLNSKKKLLDHDSEPKCPSNSKVTDVSDCLNVDKSHEKSVLLGKKRILNTPSKQLPVVKLSNHQPAPSNKTMLNKPLKENNTESSGGPYIVLAPENPSLTWVMVQEGNGESLKVSDGKVVSGTSLIQESTPGIIKSALPIAHPIEKMVPATFVAGSYVQQSDGVVGESSTREKIMYKFQATQLKDKLVSKSKLVKTLQQQNRRLRSRLSRIKEEYEYLKERADELEKDQRIWNNLTSLGRSIYVLHVTSGKYPTYVPADVKEFSINLYSISREGYMSMREVFPGLPHPKTIQKWFRTSIIQAKEKELEKRLEESKDLLEDDELGNINSQSEIELVIDNESTKMDFYDTEVESIPTKSLNNCETGSSNKSIIEVIDVKEIRDALTDHWIRSDNEMEATESDIDSKNETENFLDENMSPSFEVIISE